MKKYAVQVMLMEFETNESGELLGNGQAIDQNIAYTSLEEGTARMVYEELESYTYNEFQDYVNNIFLE